MDRTLVVVDLETTGLNPDHDRIIEIGAVKIVDGQLADEWQTLINPGIEIPQRTTEITGIRTEDVIDAQRLAYILPEFQTFLRDHPVIGHNITFDVSFLQRSGLPMRMPSIDTYALASTLIPNAPGYSLSALAHLLNVPTGDAHRALDDAIMTAHVFLALQQMARELPFGTLEAIAAASQQIEWGGRYFFLETYAERVKAGGGDSAPSFTAELDDLPLFDEADRYPPELTQGEDVVPVDVDQVAATIEPGGPIAAAHERYEYRTQQVDMLRHVTQALNTSQHLLIEAPTGVGKSMAYLLPAVHFAVQNGLRVIVSTNTINLQEQLLSRDIPFLQDVLDVSFSAAVLKGRSNYLCPRRLNALRRRGPTSALEMLIYAKTLVWLTQSTSGDRGELNLRGSAENAIWSRLSAESEGCSLSRCQTQMGGACPFYKARRRAEGAHVVIVNHALLLSDAATGGRILPTYEYVIIDEAHHLEDAVTNSMSFRTDPYSIKRQLADLGTANSGLLGDLIASTQSTLPPKQYASLSAFVELVVDAIKTTRLHVDSYFEVLSRFLRGEHNIRDDAPYSQPVRIVPKLRERPGWSQVEHRWNNLSSHTLTIAEGMAKLSDAFADIEDLDIPGLHDLVVGLQASARHMEALHTNLEELTLRPNDNTIYWVEFPADGRDASIHTAPLDVGPIVTDNLWNQRESVILASATVRTNETFDFIRDRLDANEVTDLVIDSPFDYEENTLLYLVTDIPEPNRGSDYQERVEQAILDLCLATEGRALVLFTSYAQLRRTAEAIGPTLARENILVFDQGDGASRSQLLEGFITTDRAVLMGTRSFWEGIDVPGADLSALVIVRLPFAVPTDPIYASRSAQYGNPFMEYGINEAILRFRQGFGRLIRTSTDRGVVVILDRRVMTKRYGRLFIQSLPPCTIQQGSIRDLPATAVRWIDA
jgi:DNA polymerase-3 subunit epsilon/ATP-dependent DNA helicase DinG